MRLKPFLILGVLALVIILMITFCNLTYFEYCDVNIYKNKEYLNEEYFDSSFVTSRMGEYVDKFLLPYDKIDFEYEDIQCYVFDGTDSITRPGVSLAVDFHLGDNYMDVKEKFIEMFDFYEDEKYKLIFNEYECFTVDDPEITDWVARFGLMCFNDEKGIIRQFYYYDEDYDDNNTSLHHYFYTQVVRCSNCLW